MINAKAFKLACSGSETCFSPSMYEGGGCKTHPKLRFLGHFKKGAGCDIVIGWLCSFLPGLWRLVLVLNLSGLQQSSSIHQRPATKQQHTSKACNKAAAYIKGLQQSSSIHQRPATKQQHIKGLQQSSSIHQRPATKQQHIKGLQQSSSIHQRRCKLLYYESGFETCFGWDPQHQRCRDPICKNAPTSRIQILATSYFEKRGSRCYDTVLDGPGPAVSKTCVRRLGRSQFRGGAWAGIPPR